VEGSCEHGTEPFGFHKMLGISWVAAQIMAPQEGFNSVSKYWNIFYVGFWVLIVVTMKNTFLSVVMRCSSYRTKLHGLKTKTILFCLWYDSLAVFLCFEEQFWLIPDIWELTAMPNFSKSLHSFTHTYRKYDVSSILTAWHTSLANNPCQMHRLHPTTSRIYCWQI
jgi:hypothetical protein